MSGQAGSEQVRMITAREAKKRLEDGSIQAIDVRPPFDFAGGHIPGSLSLPGQALRARATQLPRDRELLIVGADARQSIAGCTLATSFGFTSMTIEGGFEAWLAAGYPTHTISDSMA